jgi:PAS domain S-box-containing protein
LEAVCAALAGGACLQASFRSADFARSFWRLSASAFFFWTIAQAVGTYDLYVASRPAQAGAVRIILYFFSFTPLFAALFLPPSASGRDHSWESYLDFLQILIVTGTIYLLFLYAPWWQLRDQEWVSRRATTVNLRNLLLTGGFALRVVTSRSWRQRELYTRVGVPILLYSLGFWIGKRGVALWSVRLGSWFDVGWTLPFFLTVILAESWQDEPEATEYKKGIEFLPLVLAFLATLFLPAVASGLLVLRGSVSRTEVFLISGAAAAVVTCFFARLILTQYRQNRAFELLHVSEQRYRSLFEHNMAGVFCTTPDGRYLDCNDAYARIVGYASRDEVMASNPDALYVTPILRAERIALLRKQKIFRNVELQLRTKSGKLIWVLQNVTLMEDEHGNEFIEGTMMDITERKLAEARILDWKNRYEAAVLASKLIIYDWNPGTNQVTYGGNVENILGYRAEEIGGVINKWAELIHPDDVGRYRDEVARVLASGTEPLHIEYRVRRRNGSSVVVKDDGYFVGAEGGHKLQIVGFISDVSEQRMLEAQLRQSQKMEAVGQLAGGVAHDFNNLLTVIKGYSRMVLDDPQRGESVTENVEQIDAAAERAAALTRHLLAFSRKQVLQPKVIDLNALIVNLDKMLRRVIGEDIEMVTVSGRDLGSVKADPGQIEQVVLNLVVNARDAMVRGGQITIETANVHFDGLYAREHEGVRAGPYVMLAVSDTGVGMDEQTQARIFEPFFTTKEMGRGTGLGLSTVYGIVKQSGGHIWVYSEPGHGTTFKIYFARVDGAAENIQQPPTLAATSGKETILLVEDDEQVRELTRSVLSDRGYTVLVAENAAALKNICETHEDLVHLVLTDVVMPSISGREVANQVLARWANVKVLYMSGYTENSIIHHGVLDTGTSFLPKPFTPTALANKVREVLDYRAAAD